MHGEKRRNTEENRIAVGLLVLLAVIFALMGGGKLLKSAGTKTEEIKGSIEKGATHVEKTVEKLKEDIKPGEKK